MIFETVVNHQQGAVMPEGHPRAGLARFTGYLYGSPEEAASLDAALRPWLLVAVPVPPGNTYQPIVAVEQAAKLTAWLATGDLPIHRETEEVRAELADLLGELAAWTLHCPGSLPRG